jgi:gliding motility-associated-like protein
LKIKRINILLLFLSFFFSLLNGAKGAISFKENKGQVGDQFSKPRPDVLFVGSSNGMNFHLRTNGISYQFSRINSWKENKDEVARRIQHLPEKTPDKITLYRLDINWLNANLNAEILKENELDGYENYYNEVCPNGVTNVKSYSNLTYKNLYPGIDLKWYEKNGNLKYDYVLAAGVDHKQIQLEIKGAERVSIGKGGELIIETPLGTLEEKAPYVLQEGKILKAKWLINKNIISFDIAGIDKTKKLVIDPLVRLWGTYYGGNSNDKFLRSDVDALGCIYISGHTDSPNNIATVGAHQTVSGGGPSFWSDDAILVKFNSTGTRLWATYYGGSGGEYGNDCSVDPTGNYVAMIGGTSTALSGVIATPGTHQPTYAGNTSSWSGDAFLVLFDDGGVRQWGTYYGGPRDDFGWSCDFDLNGDIYIAGATISTIGIASSGAHQTALSGSKDGFLAKFNNAGIRLWGTYYGGSNLDIVTHCMSDKLGNVVISGYTESQNNISTVGAQQVNFQGSVNAGDALIVKFNSAGTRQWGTYYGSTGKDEAYNCAFDASGDIYIAGATNGANPAVSTPGTHQAAFGGGSWDAFLLKLTSTGVRIWCTFYGGNGDDGGGLNGGTLYDRQYNWCSVDPTGNVYLMGTTTSADAISTACSYQPIYAGSYDAYLAKFNSAGKRLWGTYYGGTTYDDYCTGVVDLSGNIFLVGWTDSGTGIASSGAHQPNYGGGVAGQDGDGFIAKFDGCIPTAPPNITDPANANICKGDSTYLSTKNTCNISWFDVPAGGTALGNDSLFITPTLSANTTFYVSEGSCGSDTARTAITVTVNAPSVSISVDPTILCYKTSLKANATGAVSYTWYPDQWISCTNCPDPELTPLQTTEYCVEGIDTNSCIEKVCKTITVDFSGDHNFSLPNAFTPNGDGVNDNFCLQGWSSCNATFGIIIFDRWGEKVFESSDPKFCWDGTFKGQLLSSDVYIYSVNAKYKDDTEVTKKGNITLIR